MSDLKKNEVDIEMVKIPVKAVVKRPSLYLTFPGATRRDAIDVLSREGAFGLALVKRENNEYMGFLRALSLLSNPEEQQLGLLIDKEYPVVEPTSSLGDAVKLMVERGLWEVPVVDGEGKFLGMVRAVDVLKYMVAAKVSREVGEFQTRDYPSAWQGTPLTVIGKLMEFYGKPLVIVLGDDGEPVGGIPIYSLLSEGYVETEESSSTLGGMSEGEDWDWNVSKVVVISKSRFRIPLKLAIDIMSGLPKIYSKTPVSSAAKTLLDEKAHCGLVTDARGRIEGFISSLEILRAQL